MAKQPPRDHTTSRRRHGSSVSGDPITRNLDIMINMMKEEPVPDELERLMAELAEKLDGKSDGGSENGGPDNGGQNA